ncbi:hypothetical protein LYNGBM3L_38730 [Moorena producens 3L]|uniref:Uncharacterized protein n=1 Tax=Moorena producens 3L TaxID=489825 RepID=F4XV82_9CYAN|nr:hypothetical protein LYNGBM3L_38730 [Moorena producens 3L]OLT68745.1 hypothetical protein BI334_30390 [Moorena producens 3L]
MGVGNRELGVGNRNIIIVSDSWKKWAALRQKAGGRWQKGRDKQGVLNKSRDFRNDLGLLYINLNLCQVIEL